MAFTVGLASDYLNFQQRLRSFLTGLPSIENEVADGGNTGDGSFRALMADASAVAQTWTVTCTTGGGDGVGIFSVTGSISGAQASATVGTPYVDDEILFTIEDGPTDFVVSDEFTFDTVDNTITAGEEWTEMKWTPGVDAGGNNGMSIDPAAGADHANELYLRGPGLSATDEIHVNLFTYYSEPSDYYNMGISGSIGFETLDSYDNQPNRSTGVSMALRQAQIPYWIVADGRRFIIVAKVSTTYMSAYCGFILPYATPSEYPYPLFISGCSGEESAIRWSSESHSHRSFFDPTHAYMYTIEGTWLLVRNKFDSGGNESNSSTTNIWPYTEDYALNIRQSPGDVYPMLPMVMHTDNNGGNVYGELSGCFWCPGFANDSENTIVVDAVDYLVVQDVYRTSNLDYFALKLD